MRFRAVVLHAAHERRRSKLEAVEAITLADGDRVAARTTWSGTYQAPEFRGVTVPGPARFAVEHVHIYRISDEKMIEHWVVRDDLTMLRQLGAIPTRTS